MSDLKQLQQTDPEIFNLVVEELKRQQDGLELIASENFTSKAVLNTLGSVLSNKYSEGYPHKWKSGELVQQNGRYYQGQGVANQLETLAIKRCLQAFGVSICRYENLVSLLQ